MTYSWKDDPIPYMKCERCYYCIKYLDEWCCKLRSRGVSLSPDGKWYDSLYEKIDLDMTCSMFSPTPYL